MQHAFMTVDVFTDRRFGGNPLAVVLDGERLDSRQMQSIAAEFNLAETTFVLPPGKASNTAQVRIFTPRAELPFAGHPNIGTAFVLASRNSAPDTRDSLVFEERVGEVRLDLLKQGSSVVGARLKAPQAFARGRDIDPDVVAAACSLRRDDIEIGHHQPCTGSCGLPVILAQIKTRSALSAARPRSDIFAAHFNIEDATGILLYVSENEADISARFFAPLHGIPEDPATGSANLALAGLLASLRPQRDLTLNLRIAQGVDMGRPSLLEATAEKRDGRVTGTWIGGRCVMVMQGTIDI
jgi:trans-2,3-dihydro-3-hydroxyanthranilate isomerase